MNQIRADYTEFTNRGFRAVIFDLDGTLVDTVDLHVISWIKTCELMGMELPAKDYVLSLMGMRALDIAMTLCGAGKAKEALDIKNRVYESLLSNAKPMEGAQEVLSSLKRHGYLIGVVTSSVRSVALKVLRITGLMQYVDALVAGDEVSKGKPDPEPVIKMLGLLGLSKDDVIVVGDTIYDVKMGINAGIKSVVLLMPSPKSIDSLDSLTSLVVIKSLNELLKLLGLLSNNF